MLSAAVLGFAAGALSTLSPCVLPLLPIVLAAALAGHRLGAVALAAGLAASATAFGLALAMLGLALGRDLVRVVAAVLLVLSGATLLIARLDDIVSRVTSPLAGWAATRLGTFAPRGLAGHAMVGMLLGLLWTPCGGPTLAAAATLAARRESPTTAAAVMLAYSIGAAAPLVLLAYVARRSLNTSDRLARIARVAKPVIGIALVATGLLALTSADHAIEGALIDRMPAWLIDLTTSL